MPRCVLEVAALSDREVSYFQRLAFIPLYDYRTKTGWSLIQGVLPNVWQFKGTKISALLTEIDEK
jgi:hypothetical protein